MLLKVHKATWSGRSFHLNWFTRPMPVRTIGVTDDHLAVDAVVVVCGARKCHREFGAPATNGLMASLTPRHRARSLLADGAQWLPGTVVHRQMRHTLFSSPDILNVRVIPIDNIASWVPIPARANSKKPWQLSLVVPLDGEPHVYSGD
jgi:hypothetical protein